MTPFILFTSTGLATALQLIRLIMWGVWGRAYNFHEGYALFGSLILIISGYGSLFSLRIFRWLAVSGLILLWQFYAPALIQSFFDFKTANYVFDPLILMFSIVSPLLLFVLSIYIVFSLLPTLRARCPQFLFPNAASRFLKKTIFILTGFTVAALIIINLFFYGQEREISTPVMWSEGQKSGRPIIIFKFCNLDGFIDNSIETDSSEVIAYVRSLKSQSTSVKVILTYDFGKVRMLNLDYAYIGNVRFKPYVE